jgi:hypothetical protein
MYANMVEIVDYMTLDLEVVLQLNKVLLEALLI